MYQMIYTCSFCDYVIDRKYKHLLSDKYVKKVIAVNNNNAKLKANSIVEPLKIHANMHVCKHCYNTFSRSDALSRHLNVYTYKIDANKDLKKTIIKKDNLLTKKETFSFVF